jgi:5-methylcytosine-specific restriction endonuclease McrA
MSRCNAKENLEVHHKRRDGGNSIANAQVLCQSCHKNTSTYGTPGNSPPEFSSQTKEAALKRAGNCCECEKNGCHGGNGLSKTIIEVISSRRF